MVVDHTAGAAIVTGAGGGIGSAVAHRLAADGWSLVLADRDADSLDRLLAALPETDTDTDTGSRVAVVGDVADADHHQALVAAAVDLGGVGLSVLNAGVVLPGLMWEAPIEQWQLHLDVNLWGVLHGVRAAVPVMLEQGRGHVVAVASGAGLVAAPGLAAYTASKHAVVGLMESTHHELVRLGAEVAVSVVCPGNICTPMPANSLAAAGVEAEDLSPVAEQVAATIRAGVDAGADPSTVADAIVDAIAQRRFWVLPQPEVGLGALDRVQRIVEGRPPVDLLG